MKKLLPAVKFIIVGTALIFLTNSTQVVAAGNDCPTESNIWYSSYSCTSTPTPTPTPTSSYPDLTITSATGCTEYDAGADVTYVNYSFTVKNIGSSASPATTSQIEFMKGPPETTVHFSTPALEVGQTYSVAGRDRVLKCGYCPDVYTYVTADASDIVVESDENNNLVHFLAHSCPTPTPTLICPITNPGVCSVENFCNLVKCFGTTWPATQDNPCFPYNYSNSQTPPGMCKIDIFDLTTCSSHLEPYCRKADDCNSGQYCDIQCTDANNNPIGTCKDLSSTPTSTPTPTRSECEQLGYSCEDYQECSLNGGTTNDNKGCAEFYHNTALTCCIFGDTPTPIATKSSAPISLKGLGMRKYVKRVLKSARVNLKKALRMSSKWSRFW